MDRQRPVVPARLLRTELHCDRHRLLRLRHPAADLLQYLEKRGDAAVLEYTRRFDAPGLTDLRVT